MSSLAIDEILYAGCAFDVKRAGVPMDLQNAARDLFVELSGAKVSYLLVGGLALLSFVPGRNTQDIDLILSPNDLNCLSWNGVQLDRDFGKAVYRGIDVDLLFTDNPIFAYVALHERASLTFAGCEVPCASRAGLVMMKLFALPSLYRQGNLARAALYEADVRMLLLDDPPDLEAIFSVLGAQMIASDIRELRTIVRDITQRRHF